MNGYDAALDVRPKPDAAKAEQLADAGYPNGFSIGFDCPNDRYVMDEQICTAVTSMLARIGIKVALSAQPKARSSPGSWHRNMIPTSSCWVGRRRPMTRTMRCTR